MACFGLATACLQRAWTGNTPSRAEASTASNNYDYAESSFALREGPGPWPHGSYASRSPGTPAKSSRASAEACPVAVSSATAAGNAAASMRQAHPGLHVAVIVSYCLYKRYVNVQSTHRLARATAERGELSIKLFSNDVNRAASVGQAASACDPVVGVVEELRNGYG